MSTTHKGLEAFSPQEISLIEDRGGYDVGEVQRERWVSREDEKAKKQKRVEQLNTGASK